mmetsp:Transcript_27981/g.80534  ORF Transcript_27981/g.80534 Transcript_27981/m.80534 type:complete len:364 (+) Transcript_27981:72-1163(+)
MKLHVSDKVPRSGKVVVAAEYNGVKVDVVTHKEGKLSKDLQDKNPTGVMPFLETNDGSTIFGSNAIARYVARIRNDTALMGATFVDSGLVDSWVDFCVHELEVPLCCWVYPLEGSADQLPAAQAQRAKDDVSKALKVVNEHLLHQTFLVGEDVTLADIVMATTLMPAFDKAFDAEYQSSFPNVVRWYNTCINQPAFLKACKAKTAKPGEGKKDKKAEAPKEKEKKKEKDTAAAAAAGGGDDIEGEEAPAKKQPNPLDLLPPAKMVMDEWKRTYSNTKDLYGVAMKWFWENYDPEGYCLYFVKYVKAEGEGKVGFMTCNLLSGFIQRCDKLRKHGFAVMDVVGGDGDFDIEGAWLFRGTEIPPT